MGENGRARGIGSGRHGKGIDEKAGCLGVEDDYAFWFGYLDTRECPLLYTSRAQCGRIGNRSGKRGRRWKLRGNKFSSECAGLAGGHNLKVR